jgi:electron transfer flavoprotein beta subunit
VEVLEMEIPAVISITPGDFSPRHIPMAGIESAFASAGIDFMKTADIGMNPEEAGTRGSLTRILNVYSPTAEKQNLVLKGTPKKIVEELILRFGDRISGAIGKDLITHDHGKEQ